MVQMIAQLPTMMCHSEDGEQVVRSKGQHCSDAVYALCRCIMNGYGIELPPKAEERYELYKFLRFEILELL
jgi:hypothetical protein